MPTTNDNSIVTKGILRYFYEKLSNNINTLLGKKVDKVDGKGLSTNDFTTAYKNKLDGIATGANKYVLPTASSTVLGGVKTGYKTSGKVYALQVDGNGNGYVSVPWTDNNTTYGLATTSANGLLKMLDGNTSHFMRGDGTWATPAGTTYGVVSTTANGLAPKLPNNASQYLNGQGKWTTPSGYTLPQASKTTLGGVKIGSNITVSSGTISLTKANVVSALGSTPLTRNEIVNLIYPVGSLYMSTNSTNPSTLFGGTWQPYAQGRCLIGAGQGDDGTTSMSFTTGQSGGEYTHKLTIDEMPSHQHDMQHDLNLHGISGGSSVITAVVSAGSGKDVLTSLAGGDGTHNNIQPYIVTYIWRRTA